MDYPNILETMHTHIDSLAHTSTHTLTKELPMKMTPFLLHKFRMAAHNLLPISLFPSCLSFSLSSSLYSGKCSSAPAAIFFLYVRQPSCVCVYCYYYCWTLYCVRQITINCNNLHILKVVSKLVSRRNYYVHRVTAICSLSLLVFLSFSAILSLVARCWTLFSARRQNAT